MFSSKRKAFHLLLQYTRMNVSSPSLFYPFSSPPGILHYWAGHKKLWPYLLVPQLSELTGIHRVSIFIVAWFLYVFLWKMLPLAWEGNYMFRSAFGLCCSLNCLVFFFKICELPGNGVRPTERLVGVILSGLLAWSLKNSECEMIWTVLSVQTLKQSVEVNGVAEGNPTWIPSSVNPALNSSIALWGWMKVNV